MTVIFDHLRQQRIGLPESVYCEGKTADSINQLIVELSLNHRSPVLFTRLTPDQLEQLEPALISLLDYDALSSTAYLHGVFPDGRLGSVAIVAAGTSDMGVATEAARTLRYLGVTSGMYIDVGVAGLWRLQERIEQINMHNVIICVAGMDAALVSVLGGMTSRPLIGVPTSVGYGVAEGGFSALNSMLASCASGIVVTNIDNGYGAACAAFRMLMSKPAARRHG